ncbi:hypothetical protein [Nannocystis pusilla]|uniref:hypothetical protein n=1 Tax=Nannocystis pusilla TaxID=889268 RepID=UPI003DA3A34E
MARYNLIVAATTFGMVFASTLAHARGPDFDRDGYEDLAIGAPGENVGSIVGAGAVNVLYGGASGLDDPADRVTTLYQDLPDVAEASEAGDGFGHALAWGDFDGDCYDDLVVSVAGENTVSGAIHVFYGSIAGLTAGLNVVITRDSAGVPGVPHSIDAFGRRLAAGDFNGDGIDDLAVSTANYQGGSDGADSVIILYGGNTGLSGTNGPGAHELSLPESAYGNPSFGEQFTTGDFNCDSYEDLAVGAHTADKAGVGVDVGRVTVVYGSVTGLNLSAGPGAQQFTGAAVGDTFGAAVTAANFNADTSGGRACVDLAIGAPQMYGSHVGYVSVLFGTAASGLQTASPARQQISQDWNNIQGEGASEIEYQFFGASLTSGRADSDNYADLLVGVPNENDQRGVVHAIRGSASGLTDLGNQMWDQLTTYVPDSPESGDLFGQRLTCGKYSGAGPDDFAVWVPYEFGALPDKHGAVQVLYTTSAATPSLSAGEQWTQADIDTQLTEAEDDFGAALTASRPIGVRPASECIM